MFGMVKQGTKQPEASPCTLLSLVSKRIFKKELSRFSEESCPLRYSVYTGNEMGKIQHFRLIIIKINESCKV